MQFNIIGAGRLGIAIAFALSQANKAKLKAICNYNVHNAEQAAKQIGSGIAVQDLAALPSADLTFITTPDDKIHTIVSQLAQEGLVTAGSIVAHCSGVLSSSELNPLRELGCLIASIHPLKAFRANFLDKDIFKNCDCIIEGDEQAITSLSHLFSQLGASVIPIRAENKVVYHAAAVIASNYLVTLSATSLELFKQANIPSNLAKKMINRLMHSSLTNIEQSAELTDALTGPLARGDIDTIKKHLDALSNPITNKLYRAAAEATLSITSFQDKKTMELRALLSNYTIHYSRT